MNITRRQWFFRGLIVAMVLVIVVRQYIKFKVAPDLELDKLELVTLQGEPASLSQYDGKNILLTFFATWCGPCHAEIAGMEAARPQLEAAGFVLIHVSEEEVAKINAFMAKNPSGMTYLQTLVSLEGLAIHTIPTHYVFDKEGKIRFKQTNQLDWDEPETVQELIDLVK